MYRLRRAAVAGIAATILAGCGPAGSSTGPRPLPTVQLTVLAAASLREVLDDARRAWLGTPHVGILLGTDSSAALASQIELGATADLFLAADTANPRRLADKGLTTGPPVVFATNRLTIVVPVGNPGRIESPFDLARPGLRVIAAGESVPISAYAGQVIDRLAELPGAPAGFAAAYAANVRSREDNVRTVLAKIELGEGDAAIVYRTDARSSTRVATIDLPDRVDVPASCAGVVIRQARYAGDAQRFLDFLLGPAGQEILARRGFLPPG